MEKLGYFLTLVLIYIVATLLMDLLECFGPIVGVIGDLTIVAILPFFMIKVEEWYWKGF